MTRASNVDDSVTEDDSAQDEPQVGEPDDLNAENDNQDNIQILTPEEDPLAFADLYKSDDDEGNKVVTFLFHPKF